MDFDFPAWLANSNLPFDQFKKTSTYKLDYDLKKIDYIQNELGYGVVKNELGGVKDKQRALGRYLELLPQRFNFFEKQFEKLD